MHTFHIIQNLTIKKTVKLFVPYGGSGKPLMQTRKLTVAPQAFPLSFASI
jgi:hypothetical protein